MLRHHNGKWAQPEMALPLCHGEWRDELAATTESGHSQKWLCHFATGNGETSSPLQLKVGIARNGFATLPRGNGETRLPLQSAIMRGETCGRVMLMSSGRRDSLTGSGSRADSAM